MIRWLRSGVSNIRALFRLKGDIQALAQNVQETRNDINRIEMMLTHHKRLGDTLDEIQRELSAMSVTTQRTYASVMEARLLHNAGLRARLDATMQREISKVLPEPEPYVFNDKLAELANAFPRAYPIWIEAFERGRRVYETAPESNLSVEGHAIAEHFRSFLSPYMSGFVLDIGCGPQALPTYLRGFPDAMIAGLDPLPGVMKRDFQFFQGLAEFLPWPDDTFDVVIFATSLDHVLSLDKTLSEVHRVLRPGGFCIVWAGLIDDAKLYDPLAEDVSALDEYHLFHFSDKTLRAVFDSRFIIHDRGFYFDNSAFYTFIARE